MPALDVNLGRFPNREGSQFQSDCCRLESSAPVVAWAGRCPRFVGLGLGEEGQPVIARKTRQRISNRTILCGLATAVLLAGCGTGEETPTATPTLSEDQIQTQSVATFAAELTATAESRPTETPTATASPTAAVSATVAPTNTSAVLTTPVDSCYGLTFVSDVTIPDDTEMIPGEEFTKTWRVRNSGTCDWEEGLELGFTGGERMDGSAAPLEGDVEPGEEEDVSVELTAPEDEATYRGNWRMRDTSGRFFGDEVFVQIVVGDATATPSPEASPTASATSAATAIPTSTPSATVAATATLTPTASDGS